MEVTRAAAAATGGLCRLRLTRLPFLTMHHTIFNTKHVTKFDGHSGLPKQALTPREVMLGGFCNVYQQRP